MKNANKPASDLTKREYFAAMAMQGILSNGTVNPGTLSDAAIVYADNILEKLEEEYGAEV